MGSAACLKDKRFPLASCIIVSSWNKGKLYNHFSLEWKSADLNQNDIFQNMIQLRCVQSTEHVF